MNDFEFSPVPGTHRRAFVSILAVMLGLTFFSASMWAGGTLGTGLSAADFFLAVDSGNLILGLYAGLLAWIAAGSGCSTHLLARQSFGRHGSRIASGVLAGTQIGWFGGGVVMFALPVARVTGWPMPLLIGSAGLLMTATAYLGFRALTGLSIVAVPAIAALGALSVGLAVDTAGGLSALLRLPVDSPIGFGVALSACIGSFISAATLTPDFTRFARRPLSGLLATLIAFALGNTLMFVFGATGARVYGEADIAEVLFAQGLILPAILLLGLNIWTTNDNALYASSLGLANLTGWPKRWLVLAGGTIGTLSAQWLYQDFIGWLGFLSTALPPIGAVLIVDHLGRPRPGDATPARWHRPGLAAWALGIAASMGLPGIAPVNALLAAGLSMALWRYRESRLRTAGPARG